MLFLPAKPNDIALLDIVLKILQTTSCRKASCLELLKIIPQGRYPCAFRIRVAGLLIDAGLVNGAREILSGIDILKSSCDELKNVSIGLLLHVLPHIPGPVILLDVLNAVAEIHQFNEDQFIELKLKTANALIMIGRSDEAEMILESISLAEITNQDHVRLLGLYYIYLSKFEFAMDIFNFAKQNEMAHHPHFFVFMAVNQFCLNDIEKAKATIDTNIDPMDRVLLNMFWKAKLFNYAGQHDEASFWIETALENSSNGPLVQKCFCLLEKGNTLRSMEKIDEALICYQKVVENDIGALWLWFAYFEYAMTLVYLDRIDDALSIALRGCNCKSYKYNSKFNPCSILSGFLSLHLKKLPEMSVHDWADSVCLWPFPHYPYKILMLILTGIALEEGRFFDEARSIYYRILETSGFVTVAQEADLQYVKEKDIIFHDRNVMDVLQSKFWPNDFNWKIFRRLSDIETR